MLKGAWILPAVMLVVLALAALVPAVVYAAEGQPFGRSMETYFKDLPGVVPQEERVRQDAYRCTTGTGYTSTVGRGSRSRILDDLPVQVYHCETANGTTYTGTRMPNTQWAPGINPHHLPE